MNIVIFGSTGPSGLHLVRQALDRGHHVTAFARSPRKLDITHERLTVVKGDALDPDAVAGAIAGHDAVMSALGMPPRDRSGLREKATRHIVSGMKQHGIDRLVVLSSFGVGDSRKHVPFFLRTLVLPLMLGPAFADMERMEPVVRDSGLDWTLVRPPYLTDERARGTWTQIDGVPPKGLTNRISRADVAAFMLDTLDDDAWVRRTGALSN